MPEIAIVGAGIAGLAAAIALQDLPAEDAVKVQIYERAKELREIGASIALGPNGMRTLERLGVTGALDESIAIRNPSGYPMVYRHYETGEVLSTDAKQDHVEWRHRTARFYRAHLQEALLAKVDRKKVPIHLGKAFEKLQWDGAQKKVVLSFTDGSTAQADLVLGADGIKSAVRTFLDPSSTPQWTGWVALRSVFPQTHVDHIEELPKGEATHVWGPDNSTFFFSPLGRGLFTVVGSLQVADPKAKDAPFSGANWEDEGSTAYLQSLYQNWGPLVRKIVASTPTTQVYPNAAVSQSLASWTTLEPHGRVTLAGDAAHAHGGAFAAGGSLALDDAWAFSESIKWALARAKGDEAEFFAQLPLALSIYEKTRKPHTDRVIRVVHEGNHRKLTHAQALARGEVEHETDAELRKRVVQSRVDPTWIHEHDVVGELAKAVKEVDGQGASLAKI